LAAGHTHRAVVHFGRRCLVYFGCRSLVHFRRRSVVHYSPPVDITGAHQQPAPLPETSTAHLPTVPVAVGDVGAYGQLCREVER